ncbi:hypothetical protein [Helicobacter canadensis]|uniref:Uncharacterized protein n=1 Tax=Helicobacter canadensis MIT 98-5491 TaxID=537970 RepID=C5ZWY2_9HELI|nr:hypothetical protein [Helicobacter canadensis]EES89650.1 hypothetical protein HCAN_0936 [Helicobacter canadensis MIT 98-5491]EFR48441.1 hypothetical protein HCMG_00614 [Helicobacter canadensis MIT 98-5491]STO99686.1 Uncharacterised protein [Helicobacter canadensis]
MGDYKANNTQYSEELAIKILGKLHIKAALNNSDDITKVDLLAGDKNIKIDVQYSQNFSKYGDLRVDFVSAYSDGCKGSFFHNNILFQEFEKQHGFKVDKVGKWFQDDYLDAAIILFYNHELKRNCMPDRILIIRQDVLLESLCNKVSAAKLNHKKELGDKHGSAFIPINVEQLVQNYLCYYGSISDLTNKKDDIKKYLNY